jgi:hypothetical protein
VAEAVAFDDAVALAISWLKTQYVARGESAKVASKVPNPRPNRFTRVSDGGGIRRNLAQNSPRLIIDSWDSGEVSAYSLHRLNRALIGALDGETIGDTLVSVVTEVGNPGLVYDPDTNLPRYQFTVELILGGTLI